jgi:hypothetical protein
VPDDQPAVLDQALEQVVAAARAHLAAVRAANGAADDRAVWRSYVALNNASHGYDQLLLDAYGEVTPWDTEPIEPLEADRPPGLESPIGELRADPYPSVVSVRQRRDYRVPSTAALLAAAARSSSPARPAGPRGAEARGRQRPATVAEAVLELVGTGDGALGSLDLPELEPVAGVVEVVEVPRPLPPGAAEPDLFRVATGERRAGRLDERPFGIGEQSPHPEPATGAESGQ